MLLNILLMMVLAKGIVVKGNVRISKDVIISRISKEAHDNEEAYMNDYKSLVGTGFFKQVDFEKCGENIVVTVVEHSTINQIAFEGNKKMKDEQLVKITKKFNIESRRPFPLNATHLAPVIQAMKEEYRQMSVPVEISISTTNLSENRVNVIFNINEEPKMRIKEIRFEGLKAMKAGALRSAMYTKKYNPVKFFSQDHFFVLERVEYDNRAILEYMRNHGYPNAKVSHTFVQVDPKSQDYRLVFYVEEGDKYTIGSTDTDTERKDLPLDVIRKKILVKKGQTYNFGLIRSSLLGMQDALSKRGFNTLDFDVNEKQDAEKKTIDIFFKITKGKNITIRRIHIIGNTRTRHDVILDRIKMREGDRFNRLKLMEAQRNLEGTGFFKEVKVEPTTVDEHAMDITIRLTEARTGSISFNLGYGTLQGMMASIGVTDPNIKG
ncbi:MAG: outer membrane protein assembly factor BamA, partial [Pseudomonadota bacterium]